MPRWEMLTSPEIGAIVAGGMDMAILPVGATEQHAAHLATGTDTASADLIARKAAERTGVLVLPAVPYGCSLGHTELWPGTVSLHPATLTVVVLEVSRWAIRSGIKRLLYLSGHATNSPCLGSAILQLRYEEPEARFRQLGLWDISERARALYVRDGEDFHANRGETSVLMHLDPDMVRPGKAFDVEDVTPGKIWVYPMPRTTPTGAVGRPSEASAADGEMMVKVLVDDLSALIERALAEDWPAVPPAPQ